MLIKWLLLVAVCIAPFTAVSGQEPVTSQNDLSPEKWEEYSSPLGSYRIRFPKTPRDVLKTEGQYESRGMEHKGLLIYRVVYVDYKEPIEDPARVKTVLQGIKNAALNAVRDRGLLTVAEREVEVDGHYGILVHLELQRRDVIRMQWVIAGSRLYTLSTMFRRGSPGATDPKDDYENISAAFINSFHIIP